MCGALLRPTGRGPRHTLRRTIGFKMADAAGEAEGPPTASREREPMSCAKKIQQRCAFLQLDSERNCIRTHPSPTFVGFMWHCVTSVVPTAAFGDGTVAKAVQAAALAAVRLAQTLAQMPKKSAQQKSQPVVCACVCVNFTI